KIADDYYDFYWNYLNKIEVTDELPDEMMIPGLLSKKENSELKSDFIEVYDLVLNYSSLAKKKIKSLMKKFPDNPAICFLELTVLRLNNSSMYQSKVEEYVQKFPNYSLIKLLDEIKNCVISQSVKENIAIENIIETYFPNRKSLHRTEIFHVFLLMLIYSTRTKNIELLDALDFLMEEFNLKEQELELLEYFVTMGKFEFILSQLQKE
ncbi:MAG TPA: hypothetical protein VLA03_03075, partial [Draconibacterium sp.]|nr:hypothetical protein [Draconibacterium sp.]